MIKFNEKEYLSLIRGNIDKKTTKNFIDEIVSFVRRNVPKETIEMMVNRYDKACGNHLLAIACAYEQIAHQLVAYYKEILTRLMENEKESANKDKNVN